MSNFQLLESFDDEEANKKEHSSYKMSKLIQTDLNDVIMGFMLSDSDIEAIRRVMESNALDPLHKIDLDMPMDRIELDCLNYGVNIEHDFNKAKLLEELSRDRINYEIFSNIPNLLRISNPTLSNKVKCIFLPSVYKIFVSDELGTISIRSVLNYIKSKVGLVQHRLTLGLFDLDNSGYLTLVDLEQYILSQIPVMFQFQTFNPAFFGFYIENALAKFFFLLDEKKSGKISIQDLIGSDAFKEFNEMRQVDEENVNNWFSPKLSMKIRGIFVSLDADRDKFLSTEEFSGLFEGNLTDFFQIRLFEEYSDALLPGTNTPALV